MNNFSATKKKKILILHTSVGLGHKTIAENIGWYLEQGGHEVRLADIGTVQKGRFERMVVMVHQFINTKVPIVWAAIYRWAHYPVLPFRIFIAGFNYKSTKKMIDEYSPDLIITTQTAASGVIAYLKQKKLYQKQFAIAFSDYHLHPYWLYKQADFYLVNIEEQKRLMIKQGIAEKDIFVIGMALIPKMSVFIPAVKEKLGIRGDQHVLLLGSGSLGTGFKKKDMEELLELPNTKILFACGKNELLYENLKNYSHSHKNLIPLRFYQPMAELYAITDIFVGKPGGLSVAESLQWNLPLLVTYALPGQEEKNITYLRSKNLIMERKENIAAQVKEELRTHQFKRQLSENKFSSEIIGSPMVLAESLKRVV
jgi:processive 1,2-diacylglycerol beta-glucosyltransferase